MLYIYNVCIYGYTTLSLKAPDKPWKGPGQVGLWGGRADDQPMIDGWMDGEGEGTRYRFGWLVGWLGSYGSAQHPVIVGVMIRPVRSSSSNGGCVVVVVVVVAPWVVVVVVVEVVVEVAEDRQTNHY